MSGNPGNRPWEDLPNPYRFPPLWEQAQNIYTAPPDIYRQPRGVFQRTSPVGRDWLGVGFQKGDILLANVKNENELFEVDEIFLDDSRGQPYSRGGNLAVEKSSNEIFLVGFQRQPGPGVYRSFTTLQRIDRDWIGTHLGVVVYDGTPGGLDASFAEIRLQTFRVRCKPLGGGKKRNLSQDQITVFGQDLDRNLLEPYLASRAIPFIGDPFPAPTSDPSSN